MGRKIGVTGIHTILIQVSDANKALAFWRDGLGIPFRDPGYGDGAVEAKVGDVIVILHPDFSPSMKDKERGAGITIHLRVPDVDAYHAGLRERGMRPHDEPEDKPWGREFSIVDPDGYHVEVLGPRKRTARVRP